MEEVKETISDSSQETLKVLQMGYMSFIWH